MNGRDLGTRVRPVWALAIASATGVVAALFLILGASPLAVVSAVVAGALGNNALSDTFFSILSGRDAAEHHGHSVPRHSVTRHSASHGTGAASGVP